MKISNVILDFKFKINQTLYKYTKTHSNRNQESPLTANTPNTNKFRYLYAVVPLTCLGLPEFLISKAI